MKSPTLAALAILLFAMGCGEPEPKEKPTPMVDMTMDTGPMCTETEALCDGACLDVQQDTQNCGACGNRCGRGATCLEAECQCLTGGTWCGPGQCVKLFNSSLHCGACNNKCEGALYCVDGECVDAGELAEVVNLTNQARAQARDCGGEMFPAVGPLSVNMLLEKAAQGHAEDMAARGYFEHDTPDGVTPTQRMRAAGYMGRRTGENIAQGYSTAAAAVQGWIDSPGHCRNMMNAGYTEIGIGYFRGGPGRHYWVQNFGSP